MYEDANLIKLAGCGLVEGTDNTVKYLYVPQQQEYYNHLYCYTF